MEERNATVICGPIYNGELLVDVTKRIDKLSKQLYVQSKSFDEVWDLVKNKNDLLASIPAINL